MLYFACYKSESDKLNRPNRSIEHASNNESVTLCGRRISLEKRWTHSSGMADVVCVQCQNRLDQRRRA